MTDQEQGVERQMEYRTFAPDLELRRGGDGRTIVGIAVPWDVIQPIDDRLTEVWRSGAFDHQLRAANRVRFANGHVDLGGKMIGGATLLRNDAAGLYGEWRVSKTRDGDEALELYNDGFLRQLSIGFRRRPGGDRYMPGGITERISANLFEVAMEHEGAFGEAAEILALRARAGADEPKPLMHEVDQILQSLPPLPIVGA